MSRPALTGFKIQEGQSRDEIQDQKQSRKDIHGKDKSGEQFYVFNLKDIETYISETLPDARADTLRGVRAAVKQFLGFGEVLKEKKSSRGKITHLEAKITFSTVRAFNNHMNKLKKSPYFEPF